MNLNQILEELGFGRFHYLIYFVGGTTFAIDNLAIIGSSVIVNYLGEDWSLSDRTKGIMGGIFMFGMFSGCYICGTLADKKGRTFPFKRTMILVICALTLLLLSVNVYMVCIGLFLYGFTAGGEVTIGPVIFQEFCPPSKQYTLVSFSFMWCFGGLMAAIAVSVFILIDLPFFKIWQWFCLFNIVLAFCIFFLRLKVPETPRFLVANNREREAQDVLKQMSETNKKDLNFSTGIELVQENSINEISLLPEQNKKSFSMLWRKKYFRTTILFTIAFFSSQISFNFLNFFMPELLKDAGITGVQVYLTIAVQQLAGFPGVLLTIYLVETRCGRKFSIAFTFMSCGLLSLAFIFSRESWELVLFTAISTGTNYQAFSVLFTITPESYETSIRNTAVGWANTCGKFGGLIGPLLGGPILDMDGGFIICIVLSSALNIFVGIISCMFRETKGKSIE